MNAQLSPDEITAALEHLDGWRLEDGKLVRKMTMFDVVGFPVAVPGRAGTQPIVLGNTAVTFATIAAAPSGTTVPVPPGSCGFAIGAGEHVTDPLVTSAWRLSGDDSPSSKDAGQSSSIDDVR